MGVLLGKKGTKVGLFVGKQGNNPASSAYDADDDRFLFSSEWPWSACIYAAGTVPLGTQRSFTSLGYKPMIRFEFMSGSNIHPHPGFTSVYIGGDRNDEYAHSRFKLVHIGNTAFRIDRRESIDTAVDTPNFRYIIYTLPAEA